MPRSLDAHVSEINELVGRSLQNRKYKDTRQLGPVDDRTAHVTRQATGIDISGRAHRLTSDRVRHTIDTHGNPVREALRGQVAVDPKDFGLALDVIRNADAIKVMPPDKSFGWPQIEYSKRYNGTVYIVQTVVGKKWMDLASIYKRPSKP